MNDPDLSTATPEQLAELGPAGFARLVTAMPDKAVDALLRGPSREPILSNVFTRMPELFRPERAGGASVVTHWSITEARDGGSDDWTVRVADDVCTVAPGHEGDANLTLTMSPLAFIKVITKTGNPVMMFMTGKLKASGDLGLAATVGNWFEIPEA